MPSALVSNGSRILVPAETEAIRTVISKPSNRVMFDLMLYTGLRLSEVRQLAESPAVYDPERRALLIKSGKKKATQKSRNVDLCDRGVSAVERYLDQAQPKVPASPSAWQRNLIRWARAARLLPVPGAQPDAFNPCRLTVRTSRKTIESWLMAIYPQLAVQIVLSQGHTQLVAVQHYLNLNFTSAERAAIADQVAGWHQ